MPEEDMIAIGELRWPVQIVTRAQAAQPAGTGIDEPYTNVQFTKACIRPVGALTFWGLGGEQVDGPITHRVFVRWVDYITNADAVIRKMLRRDGSYRTETFRVRRVKESNGRQRLAILEVEIEKAV